MHFTQLNFKKFIFGLRDILNLKIKIINPRGHVPAAQCGGKKTFEREALALNAPFSLLIELL